MPDELYYATKAAYEEGYETAQQSCCEMMILRERLLARWIEWARMHGHLDHAAGIADDTREILPPQTLAKACERCGRPLPIDTPPSVYGCTAGVGCADYSIPNAKHIHP
jgi:hypothetical protein